MPSSRRVIRQHPLLPDTPLVLTHGLPLTDAGLRSHGFARLLIARDRRFNRMLSTRPNGERLSADQAAMTTMLTRTPIRTLIVLAVTAALLGPAFAAVARAATATSNGWTTSAAVSPTVVAPGDALTITADVMSEWSRSALVDVEVYGPDGKKLHQQAWDDQSFSAGKSRAFSTTWNAPASAAEGVYTVKIGVFATGWDSLQHWNNSAATFEVAIPASTLDGAYSEGGWETIASVSPASAVPGESVTVSASVYPAATASALIDVEVHGPSGKKVFQKAFDNQSFTAGQVRTYDVSWNVPSDAATGTYVVKVGVFDAGWGTLRHWNNAASSLEVSATSEPAPEPSPSESETTEPAPEPSGGLPPAPDGWPSTIELGMTSIPGGGKAVRDIAPFEFRYKYLAGGVNTGNGWATWNKDGYFVNNFVKDTRNNGMTPVFTYYMLYQSKPGNSMGEKAGIKTNLETSSTMSAYYDDLKLFFQRANEAGGMIVLHVEPDLWAYIQQMSTNDDAQSVAVKVGSSGMADVAGLPDNAAGFAQAIVRLRDQYAPNVVLGFHYNKWGTGNDFLYSDPSDDVVRSLGERTARFYTSLGAAFDVGFHDLSDRDAAFKQYVYGDGGKSWFTEADYRRSVVYIDAFTKGSGLRTVLWQLPLGNTKMRAMNNTWNHYQDNKVEWLLDEPARTHLDAYNQAGVIAYLFGRGAGGATCQCDAAGDGVTNPAPINGNTRESLSADDDGGFFRERATAYYQTGASPLPQ